MLLLLQQPCRNQLVVKSGHIMDFLFTYVIFRYEEEVSRYLSLWHSEALERAYPENKTRRPQRHKQPENSAQ